MADKPSYPTHDAEWKYDLALNAVTGESFDLHGPANPSDGWFKFDSEVNEKDDFSWRIRGSDFGFAVNINRDALDKWGAAVKAINSVMGEVEGGNHGTMNADTLHDFLERVADLGFWLTHRSDDFHKYAVDLSSDDSGFKGTAAYLIADRLRQNGDGLGQMHKQLTSDNGVGVPKAVAIALQGLRQYGKNMAEAWFPVQDYLYNFATSHVNWWMQVINDYMAQPPPTWTEILTTPGAGSYQKVNVDYDALKRWYTEFPWPAGGGGTVDLTRADAWRRINTDITDRLTAEIKTYLDNPAAQYMGSLREAYDYSASAIVALTAPIVSPTPPPKGGDGGNGPDNNPPPPLNLPPPPPNLPPPPPNLPPPPGGPDTSKLPPPPGALDTAKLPPPPGALDTAKLPPGALDTAKLPPPPGALDTAKLPPGALDTSTLPPPARGPLGDLGGVRSVGPGVGLPGALPLPGSTGSRAGQLPSDGRLSPEVRRSIPDLGRLPAGGLFGSAPGGRGSGIGPADPRIVSSGLHLPELASPPGAGAGLSTDLTRFGAGSGPGGGAAGWPGAPNVGGGQPGAGGPAAASGSGEGSGGVPFFPPMMGGAGAGPGEKPQERERQTWLAEDAAVWGTDVDAGSGVIGRVEDDDGGDEALAAAVLGEELHHPAVRRHHRRPAEQPEERTEDSVAPPIVT